MGSGTEDSSEFTPGCSAKALGDTGSCKHVPSPSPSPAVVEDGFPQPPAVVQQPSATIQEETQAPAVSSTTPVSDGRLHLPAFEAELTFDKVLGKGASGATVLHCTAKMLGCSDPLNCAAKVLPLGPATFSDMIESFGQEVSLHSRLQHPGLVKFIGSKVVQPSPVGEGVKEAYVLLTELCDGGTLLDLLDQRRRSGIAMTTKEAQHVLAPIASALAYLHDQTVLHRDLKAANIFAIASDGSDVPEKKGTLWTYNFKLGDFDAGAPRSRAQTPCQTPQWMAPEAMSMEGYGRAGDIWSLGMLVFELIELGAPPYGEDIMLPKLEALITAGEPPSLSHPGQFPELEDLMRRCLNLNPADRPSAHSLASELANCI